MQKLGPILKCNFSRLDIAIHCFVPFCKSLVYQVNLSWLFSFFFLCEKCWIVYESHFFPLLFSGYGSCFIPSLFDYGLKVHALLKACACKKVMLCNITMSCLKYPSQILFRRFHSYIDIHINIMYCKCLLCCHSFVCWYDMSGSQKRKACYVLLITNNSVKYQMSSITRMFLQIGLFVFFL